MSQGTNREPAAGSGASRSSRPVTAAELLSRRIRQALIILRRVVSRQAGVVGKVDRPTPLLKSAIHQFRRDLYKDGIGPIASAY